MDINKVVKQYKDAITNYHVEVAAYNKNMKKYDKKKIEYDDAISRLIRTTMYATVDGENLEIYFYITAKGFEKLKMAIGKIEVEVKVPREPTEPHPPTLEVGTGMPPSGIPF